jgi:hypothetical protein
MALGDGSFAGFGLGSTSQSPLLLPERRQCSTVGFKSVLKRCTAPATDALRPWDPLLMQWRSQDSPKERGLSSVGTIVDLL